MSKPKLTVTSDFTDTFNETIKRFKRDDVLVGIPEAKTNRKEDAPEEGDEPITNAAILAINVFGSPANNIPSWDVMSIGIRKAKNEIAEQFKVAAKSALTKGFSALDTYWNRVGIIASVSIKKTINEQDGAPDLSERTLAERRARGFKGDKRLIVTGQMRNAITYVTRSKP